jgi:drug/metabolite transporter (DMT)-like permease
MLVALAAIWGIAFPLTRIAVPEFGPVSLIAVRIAVGVVLLIPLMTARHEVLANWRPLFVLGLLNTAVPFALFAYSVVHISSGFAALLNSTTPMFGALLAALVFQEQLSRGRALGIALGFIGVGTLVWDSVGVRSSNVGLGVGAALLGAALYAVAATYAKRRVGTLHPSTLAAGSLSMALIVAIPLGWWTWPDQAPTPKAWVCAVLLGVVCTATAYVIYFRLLRNVGVARATTVTFLIPVFGIAWGALLLHERVTWALALSCALVILGTALAVGILKLHAPQASGERAQ